MLKADGTCRCKLAYSDKKTQISSSLKNMDNRFTDIIQLIRHSRTTAIRAVNAELITLYWNIGKYITNKIELSEWGDSVVSELAKHIQQNESEIKGFSDKNLWRMKQFYETYKDFPKLSTLLREISWSHNSVRSRLCLLRVKSKALPCILK